MCLSLVVDQWHTLPMQTIGLVGGMSFQSTLVYYRDLNLGVQERLGGLASPKLVLSTVDFAELTAKSESARWDQVGDLLSEAARGVERAGADFVMLCTTTYHKVAEQVDAATNIPLLHLADVVRDAVNAANVKKVAFIGTSVAMNDPFFINRLADGGPEVVVPGREHHEMLNSAIYDELVHGKVLDSTRRKVVKLIEDMWDLGAGAVLLGCTELEMLVHQSDVEIPVFPCTSLHVQAALDRALA